MTRSERLSFKELACRDCGVVTPVDQLPKIKQKSGNYTPSHRCEACLRKAQAIAKKNWLSKPGKLEVQRQASRSWRAENGTQWRNKNKEHIREWTRQYRSQKAPHLRELGRKSYHANREATLERRRATRTLWKSIGKVFEGKLRDEREKSAGGRTNKELLRQKLIFYGGRCRYCRSKLEVSTFDHAIPVSRGGSNWTSNLMPCCRACNNTKYNKTLKEFIEELRRHAA